jgi:hypothetical protein
MSLEVKRADFRITRGALTGIVIPAAAMKFNIVSISILAVVGEGQRAIMLVRER